MTLSDLNAFGADTQEGMRRCLDKEDFYLRMVKKVPGDPNFQKLYDAVASGDSTAAFEAAHALKGVAGNLALTPIFVPASELTEIFRARVLTDCTALVESLRKERDELERICAE